jgi:hypothetical protein
MAKASMQAAVILSDLLWIGPHPLLDTCCKLRGLSQKHFISWAEKISTVDDRKYFKMAKKTCKSFETRIKADSYCLKKLIPLYEAVEIFLKKYR